MQERLASSCTASGGRVWRMCLADVAAAAARVCALGVREDALRAGLHEHAHVVRGELRHVRRRQRRAPLPFRVALWWRDGAVVSAVVVSWLWRGGELVAL